MTCRLGAWAVERPRWLPAWWLAAAAASWLSMDAILITPGLAVVLLGTAWRRDGWRAALRAAYLAPVWAVAAVTHYLVAPRYTTGEPHLRPWWQARGGFPDGSLWGWLADRPVGPGPDCSPDSLGKAHPAALEGKLPAAVRVRPAVTWSTMDRVVVVVPYDAAWPALFAEEARLLAAALPGARSIEHVGSTSVPGLAAKPVIDIVVVAAAVDVAALVPLGYTFRPHAFPDDPEHLFLVKDTGGVRSHHLHVFGEGSPWPARNRAFRDYLAAHPDAARRYEAAKYAAADLHPDSRARYGEAKEDVMMRLVAEADTWAESCA